MNYTVHPLDKSNKALALAFLREHEHYTLFLLSNLEMYGPTRKSEPYSGNFRVITISGTVVAVFCLNNLGNLLVMALLEPPLFPILAHACRTENIPLRGVIGSWEFCKPFWDYLKKERFIGADLFTEKQVLYTVDLNTLSLNAIPSVRFLTYAS